MKIETYSILNAEEFLIVKKAALYKELRNFIESLDAEKFRTKVSKEKSKSKKDKNLYAPKDINQAFKDGLSKIGWQTKNTKFDFVKDKVSLEVQLGKYAYIAHDITFKHSLSYISKDIDVGIEIIPGELLSKGMSSGVDSFPRSKKILEQLRGVICCPILLLGIDP